MTYSTVFDTGMLNGFKGGVNRWLLASLVFPPVFSGAGACGVAKSTYKQLVFPTWACAAGINNNYNNNDYNNTSITYTNYKFLNKDYLEVVIVFIIP